MGAQLEDNNETFSGEPPAPPKPTPPPFWRRVLGAGPTGRGQQFLIGATHNGHSTVIAQLTIATTPTPWVYLNRVTGTPKHLWDELTTHLHLPQPNPTIVLTGASQVHATLLQLTTYPLHT